MRRHARARIDLGALRHNLVRVRAAAPGARVMAAVKGDAYGHGMLLAAEALTGAATDGLAVACVAEGLALREAGIGTPVLVLQGARDAAELRAAAEQDFTLCIHQAWQLELLDAVTLPRAVAVWLKIDTGMHRMGVDPADAARIHQALSTHASVAGPPGLMTHFACADERDSPVTGEQVAVFDVATANLAGPQSLANSAAILARPDSHRDWVRPGIMLYGGSPFADTPAADLGLRPVMTLTAPLIAIRQAKRGDAIGYGGDWVCPEDM
ncbi:MAG TPA: alanine racemase, partial [Thioalkalivibrio sp.]|nr:alanine racemase [Thioalkalivibrio sp.]